MSTDAVRDPNHDPAWDRAHAIVERAINDAQTVSRGAALAEATAAIRDLDAGRHHRPDREEEPGGYRVHRCHPNRHPAADTPQRHINTHDVGELVATFASEDETLAWLNARPNSELAELDVVGLCGQVHRALMWAVVRNAQRRRPDENRPRETP